MGACPTCNPAASPRQRVTWFQYTSSPFCGIGNGVPPSAPGKLSDQEYWAILAFDLKANGVDLGGKKLDASSAPGVVLHP